MMYARNICRIGSRELEFFEPAQWPLTTAKAGEFIGLGGYPGFYRALRSDSDGNLGVSSSGDFTLGATRVIDVGLENIICGLSSEYWIGGSHPERMDVLADLGGLSGGPGFVWRDSAFHLVGVIFVAAQHGEYLRLRPATSVMQDGTLRRP